MVMECRQYGRHVLGIGSGLDAKSLRERGLMDNW